MKLLKIILATTLLTLTANVHAYTGPFKAPQTGAQRLIAAQAARAWVSGYLAKNERKLKTVTTHKRIITMVNRSPFCTISANKHSKVLHVNMEGKTSLITTTYKTLDLAVIPKVRNIIISKCGSIRGEATTNFDTTVIGLITNIFLK